MIDAIVRLHGAIQNCESQGFWGLAAFYREELERLIELEKKYEAH